MFTKPKFFSKLKMPKISSRIRNMFSSTSKTTTTTSTIFSHPFLKFFFVCFFPLIYTILLAVVTRKFIDDEISFGRNIVSDANNKDMGIVINWINFITFFIYVVMFALILFKKVTSADMIHFFYKISFVLFIISTFSGLIILSWIINKPKKHNDTNTKELATGTIIFLGIIWGLIMPLFYFNRELLKINNIDEPGKDTTEKKGEKQEEKQEEKEEKEEKD